MGRPVALVTGASAGIGLVFAERLAQSGHDLIAVARRADRLEALAARLGSEHGAAVEVLVADLATAAGVDAVAAHAAARAPEVVVNNAGFGGYRRFAELDPAVADQLLQVHVRAIVQVTRAVLPGMLERGRGAIVNVASLLAFSAAAPPGNFMPARVVYASAKAFMVAFTQLLATELSGTPVRVQVCLPGIVKTEFHEVQGIDTSRMPPRMTPEDIVTASLRALELGEVICAPAVEDTGVFKTVADAQLAIMANATKASLAKRYG